MVAHGTVKGGGGLPSQADDGVAIGTVVGDFKIHHGVVISNDGIDVIAGLAILFQNPDAILDGIGEVVQGEPQLLQGAEHAVGRFTPELAFGDVDAAREPGVVQSGRNQVPIADILGPGDNLHRLLPAHVHLADPHVVRVGVPDHGENLTYHHVAELPIQALIGLHLLPCQGHGFHKFLI